MHGLTGGRWRSDSHGEPEPCTRWETNGTEPDHLPLADQPAAYLTDRKLVGWQHRYTAAWLARLGVDRLSGKMRYETAHASR